MKGAKKAVVGFGLFLAAITWCVLQTAVGCIFAFSLLPTSRVQRYRGMVVIYHPYRFTFSLGTFAFISDRVERPREARGKMYGHFLQSLLYGPAFLFVVLTAQLIVRIPSVRLRREERGLVPSDVFADKQAARLAAKAGEGVR